MDKDPKHIKMMSYHGTALQIYACGVIISGESGIGKSELALSLINRGHKLIADDSIKLEINQNKVNLISQNTFMHIRGIGFINIAKTHDINHLSSMMPLCLIIELTNTTSIPSNPLQQLHSIEQIANLNFSKFQLPVMQNRPLADLIEIIVKYWQNCQNGHNSHTDFIQLQDQKICN
jgi:HPr kinase/phosphorylase